MDELRFSVELTDDPGRLAAVIPQWEALAAQALEPNPLYEHWMLLPALRFFGDPVVCALVWMSPAARADAPAELAGLFPFVRVRRFNGIPAAALSSWARPSWMLGTPLVRAAQAARTLGALLDWVEHGDEGYSVLEFRYLAADGAYRCALAEALRERKSMVLALDHFTRAFLRRSGDGEAYVEAAMSAAGRRSVRRKERRLAERGALARAAMRPGEDPWPWIDSFLELERAGGAARHEAALASSRNAYLYACEALQGAQRRNRLRIAGLDLDGRPVSRACSIAAGDGAYAYRTAYDPAFGCYSPGLLTELDSIRHFHTVPGLRWVDSVASADNITLNRLWKERRMLQTVVVGAGTWGEMWISMLPTMRWAKRRVAGTTEVRTPVTSS